MESFLFSFREAGSPLPWKGFFSMKRWLFPAAALLAAGGKLYLQKQAGNGVTMALALAPFAPDWRWQDE